MPRGLPNDHNPHALGRTRPHEVDTQLVVEFGGKYKEVGKAHVLRMHWVSYDVC